MTGEVSVDGWEIDPDRLRAMLDAGEPMLLLDCRTPPERDIARIEGSVLVPMDELAARLEELREHADEPVVVYCHSGQRSLIVTSALRRSGFSDVTSLAGGIDRWSLEIDGTVPRY